MSKLDHDDPRWTAYVLGELAEDDAAELEAELADNPEAREYVASLRETTDWLQAQLSGLSGPALSAEQRAVIADAASQEPDPASQLANSPLGSPPDSPPDALPDELADVTPLRRKSRYGWLVGGLSVGAAAAAVLLLMPEFQKQAPHEPGLTQSHSESLSGPASKPSPQTAGRVAGEELTPGNQPMQRVLEGLSGTADATATAANKNAAIATGAAGDGRYGPVAGQPNGSVTSTVSGMTATTNGIRKNTSSNQGYWQHRAGDVGAEKLALATIPAAARVATEAVNSDPAPDKKRGTDVAGTDTDGDSFFVDSGDEGERRANTEAYDHIVHNPFVAVADDPRSTFSIDVDTAAYANMRRYLTNGARPPHGAVRIEELINYFSYRYEGPKDTGQPFAMHVEMARAPWNREHKLMKIGIKGREIEGQRPRANLVFLLDVSGSMSQYNKLPLLRRALGMLVERLDPEDRVAIVVYAGASGLVLPSTAIADKHRLQSALERLKAGGSTNGGEGIELAYKVAAQNFVKGGINRVILATDGDFNVGTTSRSELVRLIEKKAKSGVFLTVLGFGMGNYKDGTLEQIADHGNGNYAYIDTISEARKVLVNEVSSTLVTIAKDVKLQLEFNPLKVESFRLIGYENRVLAHQDFNDDTKDAGDIGAGHTVTALYEIVPVGAGSGAARPKVDALKYQRVTRPTEEANSDELLTLKLRYKAPDGDRSELSEWPVRDRDTTMRETSSDFAFAAAVAAFGMILRDSPHRGQATIGMVEDLATRGAAVDPFGYRAEFLGLVKRAQALGAQ